MGQLSATPSAAKADMVRLLVGDFTLGLVVVAPKLYCPSAWNDGNMFADVDGSDGNNQIGACCIFSAGSGDGGVFCVEAVDRGVGAVVVSVKGAGRGTRLLLLLRLLLDTVEVVMDANNTGAPLFVGDGGGCGCGVANRSVGGFSPLDGDGEEGLRATAASTSITRGLAHVEMVVARKGDPATAAFALTIAAWATRVCLSASSIVVVQFALGAFSSGHRAVGWGGSAGN